MRIAMLSNNYDVLPYYSDYASRANMVSLLIEGLLRRDINVTTFVIENDRFSTKDRFTSDIQDCLRISEIFEQADEFDIIHNHLGCLPLTYINKTRTPIVTTIHDPPSAETFPVYKKYNGRSYYVSISDANRVSGLNYCSNIYAGVDLKKLSCQPKQGTYLLFYNDIAPSKGIKEAIEVAKKTGIKLIIVGFIKDEYYFNIYVKPHLDNKNIIHIKNINQNKKNEIIGGALVLIHTVNSDEFLSLFPLEAMACGVPVISFNGNAMSELLLEGQNGFFVSSVEEAVFMLPRVGELDRNACRQWVEEKFNADRMVEEYINLYKRIISETRREEFRPWGNYVVIADESNHKIKRITVLPGQRLSLQRHRFRTEHWYIIQGSATLILDGKAISMNPGSSIDIPPKAWHRIMNTGNDNLVFIETQTGDYFGEDDIERSEDDYGRISDQTE